MSNHEARRAQRDTLEQMLNEVPGSTPAEAEALFALFSAATGPAQGELAGEAAAVAAFRAANPAPAPVAHRVPSRKWSMTRLLSVKAAAAAVVLTSMGGVALASTGVIPTPLTDSHKAEKAHQKAERAADKAAADATKTASDATKAATKGADDVLKAAAKTAAAADRADDKSGRDHAASFAGLCTSYTAGNKAERGHSLTTAPYKRLVKAAADANATVESFCGTLAAVAATPTVDDPDPKDATPGKSAEHRVGGKVRSDEVKAPKSGKSASNKAEQAADGDARSDTAKTVTKGEPPRNNANPAASHKG